MKRLIICLAFVLLSCAHTPPNLGPAGATAWKQHEIQKDLDLLRDVAVDANAQNPPLVSTDTTRKVVTYHRSAIVLVHDAPMGWAKTALSGLDELQKDLPSADAQRVSLYISLVRTVLMQVQP